MAERNASIHEENYERIRENLKNYELDTDEIGVVLEDEAIAIADLIKEVERLREKIYEIDDYYAGKCRRMKKRIDDLEQNKK